MNAGVATWPRRSIQSVIAPRETKNPARLGTDTFLYVDIDALDNKNQRISSPKQLAVAEAPSRARVGMQSGDVLVSLVRPYLKNIAIVPSELDGHIASTAYCPLRPLDDIDSKFLFYQLIQDSFIKSIPTYGNSPPAARDDEFLQLQIAVPS